MQGENPPDEPPEVDTRSMGRDFLRWD